MEDHGQFPLRQFEDGLLFALRDLRSDEVHEPDQKEADEESDDVHPQIVDVALSDVEKVLAPFDHAGQQHRYQIQDPSVRAFSPPETEVETKGRENKKVAEELDEYAASEMARLDGGPVGGKGALKGDQVDVDLHHKVASLEDKEVQKQDKVD